MIRRVFIEFKGQEVAYDVGDCACGRTSVRHYSEGRCFYCTTGINRRSRG